MVGGRFVGQGSAIMASGTRLFTRRNLLKSGAGAAAGLVAMPYVANAQAADALKFSLEFRTYGGNAPMFLGVENGTFRSLGLDITPEGSSGSGESVTRVATGSYPLGTADASTVVEFASRNPSVAPKIVMTVFDRFPAVVLSMKQRPIKTLQDMVGKKIATGTADAGSRILPALLARNKIDPASFSRVTVDVKLRDTMLMKGDVDGVVGFDYTTIFNLIEAGAKLDDINLLYFSDFGFDFPGVSLIVNPEVLQKSPDLVRRVAIGCARSWVAAAKERPAAVAAVMKRDRLLKQETELARMSWVIDRLVLTPAVKQNGLGHIDTARMTSGINVLQEGFNLPQAPALDQIYDGRFLPPVADRKFT
jgi:NitT/TauT family transport system substrate-binding protein